MEDTRLTKFNIREGGKNKINKMETSESQKNKNILTIIDHNLNIGQLFQAINNKHLFYLEIN